MFDLFDEMDIHGDGYLSPDVVHSFVTTMGCDVTLLAVHKVVHDLDLDGGLLTGGNIGLDFSEFMSLVSTSMDKYDHNDLEMRKAFAQFDSDGSGQVDRGELLAIVRDKLKMDEVDIECIDEFVSRFGSENPNTSTHEHVLTERDMKAIFSGHDESTSTKHSKLRRRVANLRQVIHLGAHSGKVMPCDETGGQFQLFDDEPTLHFHNGLYITNTPKQVTNASRWTKHAKGQVVPPNPKHNMVVEDFDHSLGLF